MSSIANILGVEGLVNLCDNFLFWIDAMEETLKSVLIIEVLKSNGVLNYGIKKFDSGIGMINIVYLL